MGIKNTALEMISLMDIFNFEKNIIPPVFLNFTAYSAFGKEEEKGNFQPDGLYGLNVEWTKYLNLTYNIKMGNEEILNYIEIDQGIRFGKPCIKGTRITVGDILQWLSEGIPVSEILDDYPLLEEIHIKAALAFAARREEIVRVLTLV